MSFSDETSPGVMERGMKNTSGRRGLAARDLAVGIEDAVKVEDMRRTDEFAPRETQLSIAVLLSGGIGHWFLFVMPRRAV